MMPEKHIYGLNKINMTGSILCMSIKSHLPRLRMPENHSFKGRKLRIFGFRKPCKCNFMNRYMITKKLF
jgi:hypothetical protein